jgi:alpha-L-rhamnosidase
MLLNVKKAYTPNFVMIISNSMYYFRYIVPLNYLHLFNSIVHMLFKKISLFTCLVIITTACFSQEISEVYLQKRWPAKWINVPNTSPTEYGIYLFRKQIELAAAPKDFTIYISADNRFQLFVNEQLVSFGPAKGDLFNWNYDIINVAKYLKVGKNLIAVKVWNEGAYRPEYQISHKTGLLIQGSTIETQIINTDNTWKCTRDKSYQPVLVNSSDTTFERTTARGYYVAGAGEHIDMKVHIKNWEKAGFDDREWLQAQDVGQAIPKNTVGLDGLNSWRLIPSILPQMELTQQRFVKLRKAEGLVFDSNFPKEKTKIVIPANRITTILLDQTYLTNAYPTLQFSGGRDAKIALTYTEALYTKNDQRSEDKDHRDEIEGKIILGRRDIIISDGSDHQIFSTFSYRTFRYVELKIETKDTPLEIDDIYSTFTGYPFDLKSQVNTDQTDLSQIFEIGWRTARLCAFDTYMDCPYYEQLQYIGDARIQAMVTLYNTGDDRLVKNALNLMDNSRKPEGVTSSRYPTINQQIIPTFSLWYIGMLQDYMMYGPDSTFVKTKLMGVRQIIEYFEGFRDKEGSLKNVPNWFFVDWVPHWKSGMPPLGMEGNSVILDLQLLLAYQYAASLERHSGMMAFANMYEQQAKIQSAMIRKKYWDSSKKLFADTPEKTSYSQHANALAIIADIVPQNDLSLLAHALLTDSTLTQASIYFKYYLHQALTKAGKGNDYINWLDIWRKNIALGLTTWGEDSNVEGTRSDCHAWGASPNIEFFRIILGIQSAAPSFRKVRIEPHLGDIRSISGKMPHPQGMIEVQYELDKGQAIISLPEKTTGTFVWKGVSRALKGGVNAVKL